MLAAGKWWIAPNFYVTEEEGGNLLEFPAGSIDNSIKPGVYRHYKGNYYRVLGLATHSETLEEMVVYQALYGAYGVWVRPKDMFAEFVCIDGSSMPRFAYVDENGPGEG